VFLLEEIQKNYTFNFNCHYITKINFNLIDENYLFGKQVYFQRIENQNSDTIHGKHPSQICFIRYKDKKTSRINYPPSVLGAMLNIATKFMTESS
jgi:hypothetical protein